LKKLERTHRRIERLIEKLEANAKKNDKALPYTEELKKLGLVKLFARVKYGNPKVLSSQEYMRLRQLLRDGNLAGAQKATSVHVELVDFAGKVVDNKKLEDDAEKLEARVRRDVGPDNIQVDLPPGKKVPKIIEDILDPDRDKKKK
jgi:hypothetical protein